MTDEKNGEYLNDIMVELDRFMANVTEEFEILKLSAKKSLDKADIPEAQKEMTKFLSINQYDKLKNDLARLIEDTKEIAFSTVTSIQLAKKVIEESDH